jgi:hypothetical protein
MFRKSTMITLALVAVLSSFACNTSVVGPTPTSTIDSGSDRGPRQPIQTDKAPCDDSARGVDIQTPYESQLLHAGDRINVAWTASNFCGGFTALVRVSYDDGASWTVLGEQKDATTFAWRVPNQVGRSVRLEVGLSDVEGPSASDVVQMSSPILAGPGSNPNDGPHQDE